MKHNGCLQLQYIDQFSKCRLEEEAVHTRVRGVERAVGGSLKN